MEFLIELALAMAIVAFLYTFRLAIIRNIIKMFFYRLYVVLVGMLCCGFMFFIIEMMCLYISGKTLILEISVINVFNCIEDMHTPIVDIKLNSDKEIYEFEISHIYEGSYSFWITNACDCDNCNLEIPKIEVPIELKVLNKNRDKVFFYYSYNNTNWIDFPTIVVQDFLYNVPEIISLREKVLVEIKLKSINEILKYYPYARIKIVNSASK